MEIHLNSFDRYCCCGLSTCSSKFTIHFKFTIREQKKKTTLITKKNHFVILEKMDPRIRMWDSLRGDARYEDAAIENKFSTFERLALSETPDEATERRFEEASKDLDQHIRKMHSVVLSMSEVVNQLLPTSGGSGTGPSPQDISAMQKHTGRFEEIVLEKQRLLRRLQQDFLKRKERAQLLTRVQADINMHHEENEAIRHLATEQDSLRHTQRRLNEVLSQADMTREKLRAQRQTFNNVADKAVQIAERIPFINGLLKRIDAKRRRDAVVVAVVVAVCLFLIFLFW